MCSGAEIKSGIVSVTKLAFFKSKAWVMKRCTLYDKNNNFPAILEIGEDTKSKDANKKTYYLDNIQSIHMSIFKSRSFQVMLQSKSFKIHFLVETEEEADSWVRHLKEVSLWEDIKQKKKCHTPESRSSVTDDSDFESCENTDIYESYESFYYDVEIIKSEASTRCSLSGPYSLLLSKSSIALLNRNRQLIYYEWPYRYIRRYGKTYNSFNFEAGRKCQSGEGNFQFKTVAGQGPDIFDNVALLVSFIKPNQSDTPTLKSPESKILCYKEELEQVLSNQAAPNKMMLNKPNNRFIGKSQPDSHSDENIHNASLTPASKNKARSYSNTEKDENEYSLLELEEYEVIPNKVKDEVTDESSYETFDEVLNTLSNAENEYEYLNISTTQDKAFKMYDHLNFQDMSKELPEVSDKFKTWDYETLNNMKGNVNKFENQYSEPMLLGKSYSVPLKESTVSVSQQETEKKPQVEPIYVTECK